MLSNQADGGDDHDNGDDDLDVTVDLCNGDGCNDDGDAFDDFVVSHDDADDDDDE